METITRSRIEEVCSRVQGGLHKQSLRSSIGILTKHYGINWDELRECEDYIYKFVSLESRKLHVAGAIEATINEMEEQYPDQVGEKITAAFDNWQLAEFEKYRVTTEKLVPETPAIITIGNARVAAASNITPVTAEAKAGKTAVTSVFLAGAISLTGEVNGFEGVKVVPNPTGKAVIHLDTEQSEADQQHNLWTILKRAGMTKTPDYFLSYNIRTLELKKYQEFTKGLCQVAAEAYNGIHLIVIDGAADFISSVNDDKEAEAIIKFFTTIASDFHCPVIIVIHLNENAGRNGDTVARGHIGRQAIRKAYAQLNIVRKGDVSVIQTLRARKAGMTDTPLISFKYDSLKRYHTSVETDAKELIKKPTKSELQRAEAIKLAEDIFTNGEIMSTDLKKILLMKVDISPRQAVNRIGDMVDLGIINRRKSGKNVFYSLVDVPLV